MEITNETWRQAYDAIHSLAGSNGTLRVLAGTGYIVLVVWTDEEYRELLHISETPEGLAVTGDQKLWEEFKAMLALPLRD